MQVDLTIRKSITVDAPVERAFSVFTDGIASWWPLAGYSIGGEDTETVVFDGREGGRVYERDGSGEEGDWGRVLVWEPPARVVFSWHPGMDPSMPTEVEVRFADAGNGSTTVELEHRGWEQLGEAGAQMSAGYDTGWDEVIEAYRVAAALTQ